MLIGFGLPVSGAWAGPDNVTRFATEAERLGYHSLWTFQRLLVDADLRADPVYHDVLDPLLSLAFAAAHTSRIRLGVSIVNFPFVSPAYLAKQAATLDVLSAGRLDLGLGAGWSPLEFAASDATTPRRGARMKEYLQVLHTLWSDEVSRYDGEFYTVPASRMSPKPVQRPGPPVLLGGAAPVALRRAGRLGSGWVSRSAQDLSRIGEDIAVVRDAAERAGRDPAAVRIVCRGALRLADRPVDTDRRWLTGSRDQVAEDLARIDEQGVTELFFDLNWDPLVGSPNADPAAGAARAEEILHAMAPTAA
ncbi:TIGR03619 family F420-dependent LLM class oxidoreductase [Rugosimonospora acidiphila]|uniref:TIGR03619 family F420-dependent LLM class oxidoreductase n=1 Tax=Rugosimonospora acidiphila TaxID=556531 RepID=A0ABP9RW90_9ACTN